MPALPRVNLYKPWPDGYRVLTELNRVVVESGLDPALIELVKVRASGLNGCAYCIDLHWNEAKEAGETEQRLAQLTVWEESPFFTDRERAALALTDALTLVAAHGLADEVLRGAQEHFEPAELSQLVFAIAAINAWNRVAVTTRPPIRATQG